MQQKNNNNPINLFKQVLEAGPLLTAQHLGNLETLLFSFPQCGVLHAIQARSGDALVLNKAAAWFGNSATLQKVVKRFDSLPTVSANQIIFKNGNNTSYASILNKEEEAVEVIELAEEPEYIVPESNSHDSVQYFEIENEAPQTITAEPEYSQPANARNEKTPDPIYKEEHFDETQQLIIENIAASDYFVFDKAFADRNQPDPEPEQSQPAPQKDVWSTKPDVHLAPEDNTVTRYHDDKMPYSFMWWLDKTRSKHSSVYQPFSNVSTKINRTQAAPQHEVKEVFEERKKEEDLVERFIQEEPQIKPADSSKLDNENKGKQSEEDHEELITETLARIYADQMLYSKAIAAYKILMLKNPEKRRYFANQIENLQKKIN